MNIKSLLVFSVLSTASISAQAVVINFADMANGDTGESIWTSLNILGVGFDMTITGTKNGNDAYAYLDRNTGGLGVCGKPNTLGEARMNTETKKGDNLCFKGNDDNMTTGESLQFVFDTDVTINTIWFNNFHDFDYNLKGDQINIGGSAYTFTNGGKMKKSFTTMPYNVAGGSVFDISFNNEQFYVHAMDITTTKVPEPATLALMGMGLLGFAGMRRRRMN